MEQKGYLSPALGVGVGIGVGLGIASGQTVDVGSNSALDSISTERIELELSKRVFGGREIKVSFEEFPSYLSEKECGVWIKVVALFYGRAVESSKGVSCGINLCTGRDIGRGKAAYILIFPDPAQAGITLGVVVVVVF